MQSDLTGHVTSIENWRSNRLLTVREREVAQLIAHGYSNRQIAEELVIATSTAERHVANILTKLKARSRAEIAVWSVQHLSLRDPVGPVRSDGPSTHDRWPTRQQQRRHHLPVQLTSLIGRERELAELSELLRAHRLITLTGPGGVGKTRLALQCAADLAQLFADGVWLVDLSPLRNPELVERTLAAAVGVREAPGHSVLETLISALASRELLLLLDNCEHLVQACARVTDALLRACPFMRMLTTSRETLGMSGELTFEVPPLRTPNPHQLPGVDTLNQYEAVQLFVSRSRAVNSHFAVTEHNTSAVAEICRQLDGIPLAIELAAARMRVLTAEQVLDRLTDRFRLLVGGSLLASPRQQTLRATLDWSYGLLTEPERVMLRRVGVFAGGWSLEAAEAVWDLAPAEHESGSQTGTDAGSVDALNLLSSLIDKSLIATDELAGNKRYRLLETIRQYSLDMLTSAGEANAVRRRHAEYYLGLAEQSVPQFRGACQLIWFRRLEAEHDNLRGALDCLLDDGQIDLALRLAAALWWFWYVRCHFREGSQWLARVLARASAPSAARGRVLVGAGYLTLALGDPHRAMALHEEALATLEARGDAYDVALAQRSLGRAAFHLRDFPRAYRALELALATSRQLGDAWGIAACLNNLGNVATVHGEHQKAAALYSEALRRRQDQGDMWGIAASLSNLGFLALREGHIKRAVLLIERALPLQRELGMPSEIADSLSSLGHAARARGQYEHAALLFEEALELRRGAGNKQSVSAGLTDLARVALAQQANHKARQLLLEAIGLQREPTDKVMLVAPLETLAQLIAAEGRATAAARLLGAADAIRDTIGGPRGAIAGGDYARAIARLRESLGDEVVSSQLAAGRSMSPDQALTEARSILNAQPTDTITA